MYASLSRLSFFSLYVWHPLAHLSYAAYLLSPMGAELAAAVLAATVCAWSWTRRSLSVGGGPFAA